MTYRVLPTYLGMDSEGKAPGSGAQKTEIILVVTGMLGLGGASIKACVKRYVH